ncbi:MAG: PepSY domain-containing protein [Robiginitomaculum sp.]|nr:PepSY domain-containing protein [Robiginitomaculum sp.]MDQ7077748.1 PepSY domain-containing protein [Robiginitomaculum sp.]
MKFFAILTRVHKWAGLFVGLQIILWTAGGLVMSVFPIETVRSEHLIAAPNQTPIRTPDILSPVEAAQKAGLAAPITARLHTWLDRPVYTLEGEAGRKDLVDARTGAPLTPIDKDTALKIARTDYAGSGKIKDVSWVEKGPIEVRYNGPFWRVEFDRPKGYAVWVDPASGEVRAHRSSVWRLYDFFWMLHIMDYGERENFNTPWLIAFAASALIFALTGAGLLLHRFLLRPRRRHKTRPKSL